MPRKVVEESLSEQDSYTLHRNRRDLISGDDASSWEVDFSSGRPVSSTLKHDNHGTTFLLTAIDVFTKVTWCVPLKNKSATSLVTALKSTFTKGWPKTLQTYKGLAFLNRSVQALLKKYGIHHFSTHNEETKASIVERFDRTLNTRMWRYCDETPDVAIHGRPSGLCVVVQRHPHCSIGMAPSLVSAKNQEEAWQRL